MEVVEVSVYTSRRPTKRKEIVFMETMTLVIGAVIVIAAVVSNFTIMK